MSWFIYRASYPDKAAAELREAGVEAFCVMRFERRRYEDATQAAHWRQRKRVLTTKPGWGGYLFVNGYVYDNVRRRCPSLGQPISFSGRASRLTDRDYQALQNADALWRMEGGPFFLDVHEHEARERHKVQTRKGRRDRVTDNKFSVGEQIRFQFAARAYECEVVRVTGDYLRVYLDKLHTAHIDVHHQCAEKVDAA